MMMNVSLYEEPHGKNVEKPCSIPRRTTCSDTAQYPQKDYLPPWRPLQYPQKDYLQQQYPR